ncbi:MAG: helix-hairpin-helix domain-containing protein [Parabacteroides sp.]|nr:helix-hairpin-helix domain-containing protein [Parabacteroides sp.]
MEYVEETVGNDMDVNTEQAEALYDELAYLAEHPFNLNTATEERLKKLPFLSDEQIASLLAYRRRYGEMATVYELQGIKEMNRETIELLLPFIYVKPVERKDNTFNLNDLVKYARHELIFRYDRCLEKKKGYRQPFDSLSTTPSGQHYLGEPFYHSLRYGVTFGETLQAGISLEKDAGEPFLKSAPGRTKGYDFYSFHLVFRGEKVLKTLVAGDYKASFGQGLVFNQGFFPSRSAAVTRTEQRSNGLRRHFSLNEFDFLRGAGATLVFGKMEASVFYSYRKLDGTVEENEIRSFKTDGLHRTERDMEKRRNIPMHTAGGNVRYVSSNFCIGATGVYYSFASQTVNPLLKPYNLFAFRGNRAINGGVDYLLKVNKLTLYGETAFSGRKGFASLHAARFVPASYLSFLLLYRSYSRKYDAFFGKAFAQQSSIGNERGVYIATELAPFAAWKVTAYADVFRFPWVRYGINAPSSGKEYRLRFDYSPGNRLTMSLQGKSRSDGKTERQQVRLQATCTLGKYGMLRAAADGVRAGNTAGGRSTGWMVSQQAHYAPCTVPFQADLFVAYFHTGDYASRIYSYEKNGTYAFSMPVCYGNGIRLAASFRVDIKGRFTVSAKWACTRYFDRAVIGSGPEEIDGPFKADLYTALRWKF